jgi:hemoglobin
MVQPTAHATAEHTLSEASLELFLLAFYAKVRGDPDLGPIFAAAIADDAWPEHLTAIQDFWSSVLFKTGRYKGNPFAAHLDRGIRAEHFGRWLQLFGETARECFSSAEAALLMERAERIADSLKAGLFFRPERPERAG